MLKYRASIAGNFAESQSDSFGKSSRFPPEDP